MKGRIAKYGSDAWRAWVYLGRVNGKQVRRTKLIKEPQTREGKKRAEKALREFMDSLDAEMILERESSQTRTVANLVEAWISASERDWSIRHRSQMREHLRLKIGPWIGDLPYDEIKPHQIEEFYRQLLARGGKNGRPLGAASVKSVHKALSRSFNVAVRWGWLDKNPMSQVVPPQIRRKPIIPPTEAQIIAAGELVEQDFRKSGDRKWSVFYRLAYAAGARRSQLLGVKWADVDLDGGTIFFHRSITSLGHQIEIKGTKTDRPYRISLDQETLALLRLWKDESVSPKGWVFPGPNKAGVLSPEAVKSWWRRLRKRDESLHRINFHHLRHFHASYLLDRKVPILTVSARLGHKNPTVTLDVYGHVMTGADREAAELMKDL